MRRPIIAGNWKMNLSRASGSELTRALVDEVPTASDGFQVVVCPPFPYLCSIAEIAASSGVEVGGQNASQEDSGAFTGETSCDMLLDIGCAWVILGHSERRQLYGESDEIVNGKVHQALNKGLNVILCVGELLEQRQARETEAVLETQMTGSLAGVPTGVMSRVVIAYEPVWAIGTGHVATEDQAEQAHAFLRAWLETRFNSDVAAATRILYGGSVKPENAAGLMNQPNVDGALVGGASLKAESFIPIIRAGAAQTTATSE